MEYKGPKEWIKISRSTDFDKMMKVYGKSEQEILTIKLTSKGTLASI